MRADNVIYSSGQNCNLEKSRSWPSAHDWKSCIPQKGIEGSNPSFSAIRKSRYLFRIPGFFCTFCVISGHFVRYSVFENGRFCGFPLRFPLLAYREDKLLHSCGTGAFHLICYMSVYIECKRSGCVT